MAKNPFTVSKDFFNRIKDVSGLNLGKSPADSTQSFSQRFKKSIVKDFFVIMVIAGLAFGIGITILTFVIAVIIINQSSAFVTPVYHGSMGPGGAYPMCFPTVGLIYSFAPHTGNLNGIDIDNAIGTEIYATHDGTAICYQDTTGYGLAAIVTSSVIPNFSTIYGHFSACGITQDVETPVTAGTLIGYMGSTGNSTGPHVHYEVRDGTGSNNSIYQYVPPYDPSYWNIDLEAHITTDDVPQTCYSRDVGGGVVPVTPAP
jgi:hypothetical protein